MSHALSLPQLQSNATAQVFDARFAELSAVTAYRILQLRSEIFVVEQDCVYSDMDGADLLDSTKHVAATNAEHEVLATLRVLNLDTAVPRIGRVVAHPAARGGGAAAACMDRALSLCAGANSVVLDAQTYIRRFYAKFGFVASGDVFFEDGIEHVPMRLQLR